MGDLGESFAEEEDDFVPNYIAKTLVLGIRGTTKNKKTGVIVPNAKIVEIRTELEETEASNLDSLEGFNVCGDGEDDFQTGGACLWIIDEEKFNALPADQQGGFHNTQINANVAALFTSNNSLRRSHFTGESADDDAFLRVYTYQHVAERNYPGRIQKVCFCDWRKLAGVAEQTDCTLTAEANNGCTFEDGDNDDDESTIADELGWLLDPDTGDGDNPECKDNYEETRDGEDEDDDEDDDDEDDGEEEEISVCRIALYRVAHRGEKGLPFSCM